MSKKLALGQNSPQITVLSIGANDEDHVGLSNILAGAQSPSCPEAKWRLETSSSLHAALRLLKANKVPIVICESDVGNDSWKELLDQLGELPDPPCLIVTSRLADNYLWAEALNLGAYDVLAKPFDSSEVMRVFSSAWLRRQHRQAHSAKSLAPMFASGASAAAN
jgi:DNA-binding response OmpR family regulator